MNKSLFFLLVMLIFCGCSQSGVVSMNSVNNNWNKNQKLNFTINVEDYQSPKNIIFVVRNNNDYPYNNLFLITNFQAEKGNNIKTDTLNYILAEPNGKWLGKGYGDTKEILFHYKSNFKFPKNGKYIIGVKHGMRNNTLIGIEDIGIKLENTTIQ